MLLRASRAAGRFTKEAGLGTAMVKGVVKGTLNLAGKAGSYAWHNPGKVLGTGLTAVAAGPEVFSGVSRAQTGLSAPWLRAANAGAVPRVPPPQF